MERYFLGGNTARGFHSFYNDTIDTLDHVIMLKGGSGTGKSTLMRAVAKEAAARGLEYEEWYCSGDPSSLDGVYVKELSSAVVDATAPHLMDPKFPMLKERIVNLAEALDGNVLAPHLKEVEELLNDKKRCFESVYEYLNIAFSYYKRAERIYSEDADAAQLTAAARGFYDLILKRESLCGKPLTKSRKLFSRAITPDGTVAYFDHLRDKEIILVRGGCYSRSLFFKTFAELCKNCTLLYNPLDATECEGVICGAFAVVSDAGHFQSDVSEVIELGVYEGAADRYAAEEAIDRSDEAVAVAEDWLSKARSFHLEIEKFYVGAMDFDYAATQRAAVMNDVFKD